MLIDWMTLRYPIDRLFDYPLLHQRILNCLGALYCANPDGSIKWVKQSLDFEQLRSDSQGLFWSITFDGESQRYLSVGASPASLEHGGCNVFGMFDVEYCAGVLHRHASSALESVLPPLRQWQCQRIDVTANYDMGNSAQVKQALRLLLATDAPRRRTNSDRKGGDSVYWNPSSDLRAGKAYHKGPQLRRLVARGDVDMPLELLELCDNLLRLELRLGARWFRRLEKEWWQLTDVELAAEHKSFFGALLGEGLEVKDMESLLKRLEEVCPTKGQALAAHRTWALIKSLGWSQTMASVPGSSFRRHCLALRKAGISSAELCAGEVIELRTRRLIVAEPVTWWDDIKKVA